MASDKVYQLLAHGRRFSRGTPASSSTKTVPHDIAKILLKVPLNTKNQSNNQSFMSDDESLSGTGTDNLGARPELSP